MAALIGGGLQTVPASASPAKPSSPVHTAALVTKSAAVASVGSVSGVLPVSKTQAVPGLWTADSRTTRQADGEYQAQVWPAAVNYKDASGGWKPIDDSLTVASDGAASNGGNSWQVSLPKTLADPVKVTDGSAWASFTMIGASPTANSTVTGPTATYTDVVAGVTAAYTVDNNRLAETLTLATAQAPSSYQFTVAASPGVISLALSGQVGNGLSRCCLPV